jgi:FkbM family methyltransferase
VVTVRIPGTPVRIRLHSDGDDAIANLTYWKGIEGWEPETAKTLAMVAPRCSTVFDIGANTGYHSLLVAAVSSSTTVHAFEPVSPVFDQLARNVKLNRLGNIVLHEQALSDVSGRVRIHIPRQHGVLPLQASLLPYVGHDGIEEQDIEVTTVDSVVEEHHIPRVDLLKLDVEGAEHLVIAGAGSTLRRDRPLVICEVLSDTPGVAEVQEALRHHDYSFFLFTKFGLERTMALKPHPQGRALNYLCAHPDRLEEAFGRAPIMVGLPALGEPG